MKRGDASDKASGARGERRAPEECMSKVRVCKELMFPLRTLNPNCRILPSPHCTLRCVVLDDPPRKKEWEAG